MKKLKMKVIKITPSVAAKMLSKNKKNRPIKKRVVNFLSSQMQRGMWKFTHQAIAFDTKGNLQDGQHRLLALIDYGKPLDFLVAYNAPEENFMVIDTGKARTAGDVLALEGYDNYVTVASSVKFILNYQQGTPSAALKYDKGGRQKSDNIITHEMILKYLKANSYLKEWIRTANSEYYHKFKLLTPTMTCGIYCILKEANPDLTEEFYNQLFLGIDLQKDSAVRLFRQKLINEQSLNKKISQKHKLALFIKTWNSFKKKESIKVLRYDPKTEKFPELV